MFLSVRLLSFSKVAGCWVSAATGGSEVAAGAGKVGVEDDIVCEWLNEG